MQNNPIDLFEYLKSAIGTDMKTKDNEKKEEKKEENVILKNFDRVFKLKK